MCDICTLKCEKCGVEMDVHIGDFSVSRGHVYPYCPRCIAGVMTKLTGKSGGPWIVFTGHEESGEVVLFLVPYPRGIRLNN